MKKILSKIKTNLTTLWIALVLFSSKVFGQGWEIWDQRYYAQTVYWVRNTVSEPEIITFAIIKSLQRLLVAIVLVLWIINLIKIRKIDDKQQKKEKLKKAIITIIVILIIIILLSLDTRLIKKYLL